MEGAEGRIIKQCLFELKIIESTNNRHAQCSARMSKFWRKAFNRLPQKRPFSAVAPVNSCRFRLRSGEVKCAAHYGAAIVSSSVAVRQITDAGETKLLQKTCVLRIGIVRRGCGERGPTVIMSGRRNQTCVPLNLRCSRSSRAATNINEASAQLRRFLTVLTKRAG